MSHRSDASLTLESPPNETFVSAARSLRLIVLAETGVETFEMPNPGRLSIGRVESNDVCIDHALISREHAVFTIAGDAIVLEDLDSRNGTLVRGEPLAAHEKRVVAPGQLIQFGSTVCIVQNTSERSPARRLSTHESFLLELEERCAQAKRSGGAFLVVRLHVGDRSSPSRLQRRLVEFLGAKDTAACYAPGEYELSIADAGAAARMIDTLGPDLSIGEPARFGVARFPEDGRSPDQLLQRACAEIFRSADTRREPQGAPIILDRAMLDLQQVAERVALGTISVLLLGETGAGKEVFAELIHRASPRRDRPFVRINCAALTETLLDSELFGHEKGAFTGAVKTKVGLLEAANGGTVLLDELGEMPLATQAKMLRVLAEREVLRVGGLETRPIDVRFISATNRDLEAAVVQRTFRQDVLFRLNGVTLVLPPLRERPAEIEALAKRFVNAAAAELSIEPPEISNRALDLLLSHAWPGNVRELQNTMERAVLIANGDSIEPEHLPHEKMCLPWGGLIAAGETKSPAGTRADPAPQDLARTVHGVRPHSSASDPHEEARRVIIEALEACAGNQTRAAKMLGIGRRTLLTRLTQYGIRRPRLKESP